MKNKYTISGICIYLTALCYLYFAFHLPISDLLTVMLIIGLFFSSIAWLLTKNFSTPFHKSSIANEGLILLASVLWITFYVTFGGSLINKIFPQTWLSNPALASILVFTKKLFVFVVLPFLAYRFFGFTLKDFGLTISDLRFPEKKTTSTFIVLSAVVLLFEYFLSNAGKNIFANHYHTLQLLKGIPICFIYLLFDAGLIEEFFFRGLLQSRLSVILKSQTGGIVCSAIIFGLVHAPGLFLRGADSEGIKEQMPFLFWVVYTIVNMSIAGVFLGVVYSKTKNLWLVIAIHAMFDLLPNLPEFIRNWHL